jgi:hypothetical protein
MDKKIYVNPEMEVLKLEMNTSVLDISNGGGDPNINPDWGGGGSGEITWPDDE